MSHKKFEPMALDWTPKPKLVETRLTTIEEDKEAQKYAVAINKVIEDCFRILVILNSETGHGKSTSLQTIIADLKIKHPDTIVKIFDISQAWYHQAPVKYRQRITPQMLVDLMMGNPSFQNVDDCVYEIKSLDKDSRREFVALIVKQDLDVRYEVGIIFGPQAVKNLPRIIYVFEEANRYFDSFSLRKDDEWANTLNDFVSMGRNYGMRGFLVVTAEQGELSPSFRRRATGRLLGCVVNEYDLSQICKGRTHMKDTFRKMPPYHWIYYHGSFSEMFRVGDKVRNVPKDYVREQRTNIKKSEQPEATESKGMSTLSKIVLTIIATFILTVILLRL